MAISIGDLVCRWWWWLDKSRLPAATATKILSRIDQSRRQAHERVFHNTSWALFPPDAMRATKNPVRERESTSRHLSLPSSGAQGLCGTHAHFLYLLAPFESDLKDSKCEFYNSCSRESNNSRKRYLRWIKRVPKDIQWHLEERSCWIKLGQ